MEIANNEVKQGKLKSTDIFGLISIINKIDIMKDIKELARCNTRLSMEKSKILDKVAVNHFDEIQSLEVNLNGEGKEDAEVQKLLLEHVMKLLKEVHPDLNDRIESLNVDLASWKFDLIQIIIANLGRAEKDIYSWLSRFSGTPEDKFKEDPILLMETIMEVFEDPNLSKLFDLMTKLKMI